MLNKDTVNRPTGKVEVELHDSETNELIEKINTSNMFLNDGLVALARTLAGAPGSTITHMGLSGMPTDAYVTGKNRFKLDNEYGNARIPISSLDLKIGEEKTLLINVPGGINEIDLRDYASFENDLFEIVSLKKFDTSGSLVQEWLLDAEAAESVSITDRHILTLDPAPTGGELELIYRNNSHAEIEIVADYKPGVPGFINCPVISDSQKVQVYNTQQTYELDYPIIEIIDVFNNNGVKLTENSDYVISGDKSIDFLNVKESGVEYFVKYKRSFTEDLLVYPGQSLYSLDYKIEGDILAVYDENNNLLLDGVDYKKNVDGNLEILNDVTEEKKYSISYEFKNGNLNIYEAGLFNGDKKDSTMIAVVKVGPFLKTTKMNAKIRWIITFE